MVRQSLNTKSRKKANYKLSITKGLLILHPLESTASSHWLQQFRIPLNTLNKSNKLS